MTVNTLNITSGPYIGNNASDEYSYTFRVKDKTQLSVYETTDMGVKTLLTVDTDYTVNDIGVDTGGTIVRTAGNLPTGYTWYIRSNYIENQLTAFASQGGFFPDVHENQMDHLTFLIQQQLDKMNRSFSLSDSIDIDGVFTLSDDAISRASQRLGFDSSGNLIAVSAVDGTVSVTPFMATLLDDVDASSGRATLIAPGLNVNNSFTGDNSFTGRIVQPVTFKDMQKLAEGASIFNANIDPSGAVTLGEGGNYFQFESDENVTGILTTGNVGTVIKVRFNTSVDLIHDDTSFILPNGKDITTSIGDVVELLEVGLGNWMVTNYKGGADTFVNGSTGNPLISESVFNVASSLLESTWGSIGPSNAGTWDSTWVALDNIPDNVDWIEVRVFIDGRSVADTTSTLRTASLNVRDGTSTESLSSFNSVARVGDQTTQSGGGFAVGYTNGVKIPVTSKSFDAQWSSTFNSAITLSLVLTGYGFNK